MEHTGFRAVFNREVNRIISRPIFIFLSVILPLLTFWFFSAMFNSGKPVDLPIVVCNMDNSAMSRKLVRMIDATPTVKVEYEISDIGAAKKMIEKGKVYACVLIPKNLEKDIYSNKSPTVINYYNNVFLVAGGLINKDVSTAVNTLSVGINLTIRQKKGAPFQQAMANALPVRMDSHVLFNQYTNYLYYLVTTMLPIMFQMFLLLITIYSIVIEFKEESVSSWFKTANNSILKAVFGKLLPYTILFIVLIAFMNVLLINYFHIPMSGSRIAVSVASLLLILAYQSFAIIVVTILKDMTASLSIGAGLAAMAFTFSGVTFPFHAMPLSSRIFAYIFPFTHYIMIFIDQTIRGIPVFYSLSSYAFLVGFIVLGIAILPLFKKLLIKQISTEQSLEF